MSCSTFSRQRRIWSFHVVVLQRTAKKCTRNYNTRAQLLFCSLNLFFSHASFAVVVVVFLNVSITSKTTKATGYSQRSHLKPKDSNWKKMVYFCVIDFNITE